MLGPVAGARAVLEKFGSSAEALHEHKKEEACRILRAAGTGDWLDASKQ